VGSFAQINWQEVDCTDMQAFEENSFDALVEKTLMDR
jgi:hypothetical protein